MAAANLLFHGSRLFKPIVPAERLGENMQGVLAAIWLFTIDLGQGAIKLERRGSTRPDVDFELMVIGMLPTNLLG